MPKCFQGLKSTHTDRPPLFSLTPWTQKRMRKWVKRRRDRENRVGIRFCGGNKCSFCTAAVFRTDQLYIREFHNPREVHPLSPSFFLSFAAFSGSLLWYLTVVPHWPIPHYLLWCKWSVKGRSLRYNWYNQSFFSVLTVWHKTAWCHLVSQRPALLSAAGMEGSGPFRKVLGSLPNFQKVLSLRPYPFYPRYWTLLSLKNFSVSQVQVTSLF